MPVPDQVRDDGSGIQSFKKLKKPWIPGQARNDDTEGPATAWRGEASAKTGAGYIAGDNDNPKSADTVARPAHHYFAAEYSHKIVRRMFQVSVVSVQQLQS